MARRIEKHNLPAVRWRLCVLNTDLVSADVLGDTARFAFGDVGGSNRIQQRSFAMIDVAHDGDYWRTRHFVPAALFTGSAFAAVFRGLLFERDHVGIGAEEASHFAGQFRVECLIDGGENTANQQARDQIFGADAELLGQILNADSLSDGDAARDRLRLV